MPHQPSGARQPGRGLDPVAVGQRLASLREEHGQTLDELGDALGVPSEEITRLEEGARPLLGAELLAAASSLGVRTGVVTGHVGVDGRATVAPNPRDRSTATMRQRLVAYLELDGYLASKGIAQP